jgi:pimeloyl-ACP methyl ester carboxylesterase
VRSKVHPPEGLRAFLCDGVLCDGFIWKYLWDDLPRDVAVTHWHYRGHGRSAPPSDRDRIDIAAHADDLEKVRELAGDPPAVLFGHSMGCQVALENYRSHPENVRGLVLLNGSFGNVTTTFHGVPILDRILPKLLEVAEKSPELVRAVWSRIPPEMALRLALRLGEIDPQRTLTEDFMPYLQHMTHVDFPMFLRMVRAAGEHSAEDLLPHIRVPTLIVAGEKDTFTPAFLAEAMQKAIPGAELLMLAGGSHVAPIEQHAIVAERVHAFLKERVGAREGR